MSVFQERLASMESSFDANLTQKVSVQWITMELYVKVVHSI